MSASLIDSSVMLDLLTDDPRWSGWSLAQLEAAARRGKVVINPIVYAEISVPFATIEALDDALEDMGILIEETPRAGLFLAARVFALYRRQGGARSTLLPDFLIGAHAAVAGYTLVTRDLRRRGAFPRLAVISP